MDSDALTLSLASAAIISLIVALLLVGIRRQCHIRAGKRDWPNPHSRNPSYHHNPNPDSLNINERSFEEQQAHLDDWLMINNPSLYMSEKE